VVDHLGGLPGEVAVAEARGRVALDVLGPVSEGGEGFILGPGESSRSLGDIRILTV
jgi:hypothetical protein